jgi:hypothetical protein
MLTKVRPYHEVGARKHHGVYHDRADCPLGRTVPSDHLAAGATGLRYCDECHALNERDKIDR